MCEGGSSSDLTDMDDVACVSLAPRREPRVCSVHLPAMRGGPSRQPLARAGTPRAAAVAPPASAVMLRDGQAQGHGEEREHQRGVRMRRNNSGARLAPAEAPAPPPAPGAPTAANDGPAGPGVGAGAGAGGDKGVQGPSCMLAAPLVDARSLCGINGDADLLWTFLAGMLLSVAT